MAVKIMLDAGHGGSDPGAVYNNRLEKDDNLVLALAVGDLLSEMGYEVLYTRTNDVYDSPVKKASIGNASGANYFVSFHRNSSPNPDSVDGVQTLLYNDSGTKATMARNINKELEKLGFRNINVEARPDLAVLRRTRMPALLIETGFINSEKDNKLYDEQFEEIAMAIASAINKTLSPATMAVNASEASYENPVREAAKYQILMGVYRGFATASYQMSKIKEAGFDADIYEDDGLFQLRVGDYQDVDAATKEQSKLKEKGYTTLIVKSY